MMLRLSLWVFFPAVVLAAGVPHKRGASGKVSFSECEIPALDRLDCGYYGIQEEECQSRGCCWQESDIPGTNWCYHSNQNALETCVANTNNREDCGYYGINSRECIDGDCCWMPTQSSGQPWCFYSAGPAKGACGVPATMPSVDTRIVGGDTAVPHSWPWQISMQSLGGFHGCGGSLINNRWVVCAAHCAPGDVSDIRIVLGAHNKDISEDSQVVYEIEQQFVHPDWDYETIDNDIMLFKLAEDVEFNDNISPVCLPTSSDDELAEGLIVQTTGWGNTEFMGDAPSELQQLTMPVRTNEECEERGQGYGAEITDNMICAGYWEAGRGSCHGDSGGPLVKVENGQWTLYGVVSWGYMCAADEHPTLYAKVINYLDWIHQTVENNS